MPLGKLGKALEDSKYDSREIYKVGKDIHAKFDAELEKRLQAARDAETDADARAAIDELSDLDTAKQNEIYNAVEGFKGELEQEHYDVLEKTNERLWNKEHNIKQMDEMLNVLIDLGADLSKWGITVTKIDATTSFEQKTRLFACGLQWIAEYAEKVGNKAYAELFNFCRDCFVGDNIANWKIIDKAGFRYQLLDPIKEEHGSDEYRDTLVHSKRYGADSAFGRQTLTAMTNDLKSMKAYNDAHTDTPITLEDPAAANQDYDPNISRADNIDGPDNTLNNNVESLGVFSLPVEGVIDRNPNSNEYKINRKDGKVTWDLESIDGEVNTGLGEYTSNIKKRTVYAMGGNDPEKTFMLIKGTKLNPKEIFMLKETFRAEDFSAAEQANPAIKNLIDKKTDVFNVYTGTSTEVEIVSTKDASGKEVFVSPTGEEIAFNIGDPEVVVKLNGVDTKLTVIYNGTGADKVLMGFALDSAIAALEEQPDDVVELGDETEDTVEHAPEDSETMVEKADILQLPENSPEVLKNMLPNLYLSQPDENENKIVYTLLDDHLTNGKVFHKLGNLNAIKDDDGNVTGYEQTSTLNFTDLGIELELGIPADAVDGKLKTTFTQPEQAEKFVELDRKAKQRIGDTRINSPLLFNHTDNVLYAYTVDDEGKMIKQDNRSLDGVNADLNDVLGHLTVNGTIEIYDITKDGAKTGKSLNMKVDTGADGSVSMRPVSNTVVRNQETTHLFNNKPRGGFDDVYYEQNGIVYTVTAGKNTEYDASERPNIIDFDGVYPGDANYVSIDEFHNKEQLVGTIENVKSDVLYRDGNTVTHNFVPSPIGNLIEGNQLSVVGQNGLPLVNLEVKLDKEKQKVTEIIPNMEDVREIDFLDYKLMPAKLRDRLTPEQMDTLYDRLGFKKEIDDKTDKLKEKYKDAVVMEIDGIQRFYTVTYNDGKDGKKETGEMEYKFTEHDELTKMLEKQNQDFGNMLLAITDVIEARVDNDKAGSTQLEGQLERKGNLAGMEQLKDGEDLITQITTSIQSNGGKTTPEQRRQDYDGMRIEHQLDWNFNPTDNTQFDSLHLETTLDENGEPKRTTEQGKREIYFAMGKARDANYFANVVPNTKSGGKYDGKKYVIQFENKEILKRDLGQIPTDPSNEFVREKDRNPITTKGLTALDDAFNDKRVITQDEVDAYNEFNREILKRDGDNAFKMDIVKERRNKVIKKFKLPGGKDAKTKEDVYTIIENHVNELNFENGDTYTFDKNTGELTLVAKQNPDGSFTSKVKTYEETRDMTDVEEVGEKDVTLKDPKQIEQLKKAELHEDAELVIQDGRVVGFETRDYDRLYNESDPGPGLDIENNLIGLSDEDQEYLKKNIKNLRYVKVEGGKLTALHALDLGANPQEVYDRFKDTLKSFGTRKGTVELDMSKLNQLEAVMVYNYSGDLPAVLPEAADWQEYQLNANKRRIIEKRDYKTMKVVNGELRFEK